MFLSPKSGSHIPLHTIQADKSDDYSSHNDPNSGKNNYLTTYKVSQPLKQGTDRDLSGNIVIAGFRSSFKAND